MRTALRAVRYSVERQAAFAKGQGDCSGTGHEASLAYRAKVSPLMWRTSQHVERTDITEASGDLARPFVRERRCGAIQAVDSAGPAS